MLGLDPGSSTISKGQIGASYRKKAQEVHPDKALQRAHILTQALNNAKEHLDSVYP
jgi:DnaJ-class molecular chaperone